MERCLDFRIDESCRVGKVITLGDKKFEIDSIQEAFVVGRGILRAYVTLKTVKE